MIRKVSLPASQTVYHGLGTTDLIFQLQRYDGVVTTPPVGLEADITQSTITFWYRERPGQDRVPFMFPTNFKIVIMG
jgi:hypothetical protein